MAGVAIGGGAALGAGGSLLGGILGSNAQGDQAKNALDFTKDVYRNTKNWLRPFANSILGNLTTGDTTGSLQDQLAKLMGFGAAGRDPLTSYLTKPFNPTIAQLEETPGYKFTLDQGLKGVQNSYAAQGLGTSGAAMKGAADYATGLASNTYQQMFGDQLAQQQQIYNMLTGQEQLATNAVLGQGSVGSQSASTAAGLYGALGTANAQPWVSGGNALGQAGQGIASGYLTNALLSKIGAVG